jgi:hypothetical protein
MKRMLGLLLGMAMCCCFLALGQEEKPMKEEMSGMKQGMDQTKQTIMSNKGMMKDGFMMKEGKMWMMKGGQSMQLEKEMTLANGWKVMPNGEVLMKEGKKMQMKDGMKMDMTGKMMKAGKMMQHDEKTMQGGAKIMDKDKMEMKDTTQSQQQMRSY